MPDYTPQPQEVCNHFHLTASSTRAGFMSIADKIFLDSLVGSAAVWGSISGTLTNQTDLVNALALKAPLASPTFTGVPAAPTAAPGTNTTQLASTAFVTAAVAAGGGGYIDGEVDVYADLPVTIGTPALDSIYLVRDASGLWLVNRHPAGIYVRTGNAGALTDWTYAGVLPDAFSDANFELYDDADSSKLLSFSLGGATTGKRMQIVSSHTDNRVLTLPDATGTLALNGAAPTAHAASHTNGTDDIQSATAAQKGLATAAQITKLDGIETAADVTDAANVAAAGAVMSSGTDASSFRGSSANFTMLTFGIL